MDMSSLKNIAARILGDAQEQEIDVLLACGQVLIVKEFLRLQINHLYERGDMTKEVALELYNHLELPAKDAGKFPQKRPAPEC